VGRARRSQWGGRFLKTPNRDRRTKRDGKMGRKGGKNNIRVRTHEATKGIDKGRQWPNAGTGGAAPFLFHRKRGPGWISKGPIDRKKGKEALGLLDGKKKRQGES